MLFQLQLVNIMATHWIILADMHWRYKLASLSYVTLSGWQGDVSFTWRFNQNALVNLIMHQWLLCLTSCIVGRHHCLSSHTELDDNRSASASLWANTLWLFNALYYPFPITWNPREFNGICVQSSRINLISVRLNKHLLFKRMSTIFMSDDAVDECFILKMLRMFVLTLSMYT